MRRLLLLFIAIPVLEMYILIEVGSFIGAIPTIGLVVLTATLGVWLLKLEGTATFNKMQDKLKNGEIPGRELLEGIMLLIGGALLLTPGFITDAIGFCCLLPMLRKPIAQWLLDRGLLMNKMNFSQTRFGSSAHLTIIDGEYEDQTDRDDERNTKDQDHP